LKELDYIDLSFDQSYHDTTTKGNKDVSNLDGKEIDDSGMNLCSRSFHVTLGGEKDLELDASKHFIHNVLLGANR
jgi:hypothetical protein